MCVGVGVGWVSPGLGEGDKGFVRERIVRVERGFMGERKWGGEAATWQAGERGTEDIKSGVGPPWAYHLRSKTTPFKNAFPTPSEITKSPLVM